MGCRLGWRWHCSGPNHNLSQCRLIVVNHTLGTTRQWNMNGNINIFTQGKYDWNAVCEISAILFKPPCEAVQTPLMMTSSNGNISALPVLYEGNHRSPVDSPQKGQWRGALVFFLICAYTNGCLNNQDVGDLRCHRAHYGVIVICSVSQNQSKRSLLCMVSSVIRTTLKLLHHIRIPKLGLQWVDTPISCQLIKASKTQNRLLAPSLPA